jgi:LuxR family maltose regulon positive regulatory protein
VRDVLPVAWLQLAIGRLLVGDLDASVRLFGQARSAPLTEATTFVPRNSANSIALVLAMDGDLPHAREWLAVAEVDPDVQGWLHPMVRAAGHVAAALAGVDQLDREAADAALCALGAATGPDEHWAFNLWARTRYALSWGDPEEMLRGIDMACNVHAVWTGGAAKALLLAARLELVLALGQGDRALALLEQDAGHHLSVLAVARAWLLTGRPDAALTTLVGCGRTVVHGVHVVERQVLLAQVNLRLDRRPAAGEAFRRALLVAASSGAVRAFATLDPAERDALVELAADPPGAAPVVRGSERLEAARQVFPARTMVVALSARERVVLRHLAQGLSGEQIARALFVSVNTVKSQVRSVYRKLGVGSRSEAVARAHELDLLRDGD